MNNAERAEYYKERVEWVEDQLQNGGHSPDAEKDLLRDLDHYTWILEDIDGN